MSVSSKYHRFPGSPAPQAESPLFRQLHRKLSMLSLSVTGLILVILTIVCLLISEAGIRHGRIHLVSHKCEHTLPESGAADDTLT